MISIRALAAGLAIAALAVSAAHGQEAYRLPPQDIVDIVDAPPSPYTSLSPARDTLLLMHREALPPVSELARPMERLAGLRLDAATNGRHGPRQITGLSLIELATGEERRIDLPSDAGIGAVSWSPDGSRIAFTVTRDDTIGLWVADVRRARPGRSSSAASTPSSRPSPGCPTGSGCSCG